MNFPNTFATRRNESNIDKEQIKKTLDLVIGALIEKGYNPLTQLSCYLSSGDPTYITAHNHARAEIQKIQRIDLNDYIAELLIENYKKEQENNN